MPMSFAGRFAGRSAVITGGASGIGLAVALRIVEEGGRVCVWDRDPTQIEQAKAVIADLHSVTVDVADAVAVELAARQTIDALGAVDILVTSAAITGPNMTTWDYSVEDWLRVIDINVNGVFYCNKALVPHMLERNYGRIVNIASIAGKEGNPNASAYSTSKAAVIGLTKSLGKELAKTKVTVNCVTPAAVRTAIFQQMSQQHIDFMLSKIPMARFGEVEEVAALISWIASEECSFTTAAVFDVSGGRATY
ncbi:MULTISPECIES: SDR family NAD(P)-dependent oxidoreductase [Mesorhizobium]|uniref:SDR family NAD(P)-dependent oxidoreductase n=1 Tax=Mesorhizobium sp. TaxID=1871066 RepID=UPI0004946969|nr:MULTISPECIES: SDR family NAD(P)-dependent oxidoreductase [Mesorhizobium]RWL22896.1 MAG: SDR family oxidoreductase [Mesorhizobium sp.]RWM71353.1 MAG: SDR family oxidoreductase [Mesorhizobium sp.]TIO24472.1 MAG: SDR family oxidoreductase [Mesorhizobium sp.]TJV59621.1 MAG: SDR family oxidoreductase [Mesorhizobium sp.]